MNIFPIKDEILAKAVDRFLFDSDSNQPPVIRKLNCDNSIGRKEKKSLYLGYEDQLAILRDCNDMMPADLRQPDEIFLRHGKGSGDSHFQSPSNLKIPVVVPLNKSDTLRYQFELIKLAFPDILINPSNCILETPSFNNFDKHGLYKCNISIVHDFLSDAALVSGRKQSIIVSTGWLGLVAYALQGKRLLQGLIDGKLPSLYISDLADNVNFGYVFQVTSNRPKISFEKKSGLDLRRFCIPTFVK